MTAELVISKLETYENFGFKWIAAGAGGFNYWATTDGAPRPEFMTCGLCCFYLPLAAAVEAGCMTKEGAGDLIFNQMESGMRRAEPRGWVPAGLTKHRTGVMANHPNRGDVVFFSGKNAPYFAHVAVATGNGDELISFGHDAPYLQPGMHIRLVSRITIADVKAANNMLTDVHFGAPSW